MLGRSGLKRGLRCCGSLLPSALFVGTASLGAARAAEITPAVVFDMGGKFGKSFNERVHDGAEAFTKATGIAGSEFEVVDGFTVLENLMLGAEGGRSLAAGAAKAGVGLARLGDEGGLRVDPDAQVGDLPVGGQQRVEILRALYRGARLLILGAIVLAVDATASSNNDIR